MIIIIKKDARLYKKAEAVKEGKDLDEVNIYRKTVPYAV